MRLIQFILWQVKGVNLGLMDAKALAETILLAHGQQRDIGSLSTLRPYERQRKGHNVSLILAMDFFKDLFASQQPSVINLRNIGLNLTNRFSPGKNQFMRYAMGTS